MSGSRIQATSGRAVALASLPDPGNCAGVEDQIWSCEEIADLLD